MALCTDHWRYLHGKPAACAILKATPEDFRVIEQLGYTPSGEGEHIYLWVRKTGLNTAFVAEQLAKFCQLPLRAVTYAGRKDKHAVTEQWFGIHKPGKESFDWQELDMPGVEILSASRHHKKLRTGVLKGNQFHIVLRQLRNATDLNQRIDSVIRAGVPNYFGEQRFGSRRHHPQGGNLALAQTMLSGEPIRNRNKRSMAISALRAWLFNEFIHARLTQHNFDTPLQGDALQLTGSNSFFIAQQLTTEIEQRLTENDVAITAPMWGVGDLPTVGQAAQFETQVAKRYPEVCEGLAALGLKQERRAIALHPKNLSYTLDGDTLRLTFTLPAGCFATSVLREILNCEVAGE